MKSERLASMPERKLREIEWNANRHLRSKESKPKEMLKKEFRLAS